MRRVLLAVISGALIVPALSAAAPARFAVNICQLAAPSTAIIKKDLGTPSAPPSYVPDAGAFPSPYCIVTGSSSQVRIYVKPAAQASSEISGIEAGFTNVKSHMITKTLSGLGSGATLYYYPKGQIYVWFTKGSHFVTVVGYGATPDQTVTLARAAGARLH